MARKHLIRENGGVIVGLLFLLCFLAVTIFFYEGLREKKASLLSLETEVTRGAARMREYDAFKNEAQALETEPATLAEPFGSAKEAFAALRELLQRTGLSYAQFRQSGESQEEVRFEIAGADSFAALLAFLDGVAAGGYPARVAAASMEGASGTTISYRLALDFYVPREAAQ